MSQYKWCAIDAEGDVNDKGLIGVAFYSDTCQEWITDHEQITERLLDHAKNGYTFLAHNAQYDIPVIFNQLKLDVKIYYYNGRFNRGEWRYDEDRSTVQIWDTFALSGNISLASLGKALNTPKYSTPQRLLGIDPDRYRWTCTSHQLGECEQCYAIRDAEIVYCFMVDLEKVLTTYGITPHRRISGLAMKLWQKLDNPDPIRIESRQVRMMARHAYKGGRVETFKLGTTGPVYCADVCSMYPSIMAETPYPDNTSLVYRTDMTPDTIPLHLEGVIHATITVPYMYIPPLAYTYKDERVFPCGAIRGYWTIMEVRYALSLGATIDRVYDIVYAEQSIYPCRSFVGVLWAMRQAYEKNHDSRGYFAKLLMNNLYGRWGMGETLDTREIWPAPHYTKMDEQDYTNWSIIRNRMWLEKEREEKKHNKWANVMWAAQTTAAARIKLHQYMMLQGNSMVYCDTDSVFSLSPINGLGEGLGALRDPIEYESMIVAAPKMYAALRREQDMPREWWSEACEPHKHKKCQDCRWLAKAKGIPRALALGYIRNGQATYSQPVKPIAAMQSKIEAGTWIEVDKYHRLKPHRRPPINPQALLEPNGFSDTSSPVVNWLDALSGKRSL